MVYLTAVSAAIYLVSALLLRVASGYAFPLLSVAVWIVAFTLVWGAATWSTRDRIIQVNVMVFAIAMAFRLAMKRLTGVEIPGGYDWPPRLWPMLFDFPRTDYAWIALIGLASFGLTVAGVARQRRGDAMGGQYPRRQRDGFRDRLVNLFRFPCPTSSATRAQVWFDLKSTGLPLLAIGVALAIVILLLFVVSNPIDAATFDGFPADMSCPRADASGPARLMAALVLDLLAADRRVPRRKCLRHSRGNTDARTSARSRRPRRTAPRSWPPSNCSCRSVCFLAALLAVGVSVWTSLSLLGDEVFIAMWSVPLSSLVRGVTGAVAALTGYEQLALAVVAAVGVAVWVAAIAVLWSAVDPLFPRRDHRGIAAAALWFRARRCWRWRHESGIGSQFLFGRALHGSDAGSSVAAMVFTTVYLFWSGFAERVLTLRYASGAVAISAAFAAAWVTVLRVAGVQLDGMPATTPSGCCRRRCCR